MNKIALINLFIALAAAPVLPGIINRVKAFFGGRKGPSIFQLYYDLYKLLNKRSVYSNVTTWVFWLGPVISLACLLAAAFLIPLNSSGSLVWFDGDVILLAYLLGLSRFFMVLAALDTGSSFEGMGASREAQFAIFAEVTFLLGMTALLLQQHTLAVSQVYEKLSWASWQNSAAVLSLTAAAFFMVFLTENCRIPVDDPDTHLELTMVHEVMVLDHSGPELAIIQYAASLKLWLLGGLITGLVVPAHNPAWWVNAFVSCAGLMGLAIVTGAVESTMARLRLLKVPQMLVGGLAFALLALIFQVR